MPENPAAPRRPGLADGRGTAPAGGPDGRCVASLGTLSQRTAMGHVREDYSDNGDAWSYFSHDQARSRAYKWGEDGIAGISDDKQRLCWLSRCGTSRTQS